MDDGRGRGRQGAVPRVPTPLAVRSGSLWDAGRGGHLGRRADTGGWSGPPVRAEAVAVVGRAQRISSPKKVTTSTTVVTA